MGELVLFLLAAAAVSYVEIKRMNHLNMKKEVVFYLACLTGLVIFAMLYFPTPTRTSPLGFLRQLPTGFND
jgi:hypothetical protein